MTFGNLKNWRYTLNRMGIRTKLPSPPSVIPIRTVPRDWQIVR